MSDPAPSDELDAVLNELLPDDLPDPEESNHSFSPGGYLSDQEREQVVTAELDALSEQLEIPTTTRDQAKQLFDQFAEQESLQGRVIELYAAAALYCACKATAVPRTPDEFEDATDSVLTTKLLLRRVKTLASNLGLDASAFIGADQYVDRYIEELELDEAVAQRTEDILSELRNTPLAGGKSPTGWAAAATYNAAIEQRTDVSQEELAAVADVTEVTIRNRYQEQRKALLEENPPPEDPRAVIDWVSDRVPIADSVQSWSHRLINQASDEHDVTEDAALGVAALQLLSEEFNTPLGYRTLSTVTGIDSEIIRRREAELRGKLTELRRQIPSRD